MLNNQVPKSKPQGLAVTKPQGSLNRNGYSNSTTSAGLHQSKSRHDKGMELYKSGRVSIGANGLFKVSGYYECDTERMSCTCPDYKTRKESCKHLFAAMLFVKNRGKQKIEGLNDDRGLNSFHDEKNLVESGGKTLMEQIPEASKQPANKPVEPLKQAPNKEFDRQATITRLAVINSAIELLKTHRTPLEPEVVISIAAQLERWALGQ